MEKCLIMIICSRLFSHSDDIKNCRDVLPIVASSSQDDDPTVATTVLCSAPG
jgi:hypothetical protein